MDQPKTKINADIKVTDTYYGSQYYKRRLYIMFMSRISKLKKVYTQHFGDGGKKHE